MYYLDFISNLKIIISSYSDIDSVNAYINSRIDLSVSNGSILECNKPSYFVYKNILTNSIDVVPADWLTIYMDNTIKYGMDDTLQYDRFQYNLQNEPDFIDLLKSIFSINYRKYKLHDDNVYPSERYYYDEFKFPNISHDDVGEILYTLKYEFNYLLNDSKISHNSVYVKSFDTFERIVYTLIKKVDHLYSMSNATLDVHYIWSNLFITTVRKYGIIHYPLKCDNAKFESLIDIYKTRIREEYVYRDQEHPKPKKVLSDLEKMLLFMGLQPKYNNKQLKKRFRKLAIRYHPDKHGGDSDKFIYLKQCYETLEL